jgi:hypothetical protein
MWKFLSGKSGPGKIASDPPHWLHTVYCINNLDKDLQKYREEQYEIKKK